MDFQSYLSLVEIGTILYTASTDIKHTNTWVKKKAIPLGLEMRTQIFKDLLKALK